MQVNSVATSVRRIAVLRPNHRIGNTLLLTPLVQELSARFPDAQIDVVTACSEAAAVFERYEGVSVLYTFPSHSYRHPLVVVALLLKLRRHPYDLAIDPMPRSRAGRFLLGWVRARDRVGYRWGVGWRDHALTQVADAAGAPRHFAHAPVHLLRIAYVVSMGQAPERALPLPSLDLRLTAAEQAAGKRRLDAALESAASAASVPAVAAGRARAHPTLAVFAHASGKKGFAIEWWRQLINAVRRCAPDVRLLEIVPADRQARLAGTIPALHTPELRLLGATLAAASLVVIPDGGVMHVAEAAGARVLGLFKTTNPSQYGPTRAGSEALWAAEASPEAVAERICVLLGVGTGAQVAVANDTGRTSPDSAARSR
jgi:heptosyltransferase III